MTLQTLADAPTDPIGADQARGLTVAVFDRFTDARAQWLALEADGCLTPYQRYDWLAALHAAGLEPADELAIVVASDAEGPVAVLPLAVGNQMGVRIGRLIGAKWGNADWLAHAPRAGSSLGPVALKSLFDQVARGAGIDLLSFVNMPQRWNGIANPLLAFPHARSANNLYFAPITHGEEPYINLHLPQKKRTNLRRGIRRLAEMHGEVALRRATTADEIGAVLDAFLRQRGQRFAEMGVENVFGSPEFAAFFTKAGVAALGSPRPALCFDALHAGEEIVATSIGTYCGDHYSQYINSTTDGPAAKISLMGVLLSFLLDRLTAEGVTSIDMGTGDFAYKTDWSQCQPAYDCTVALTARGRLAAGALTLRHGVKRTIKQSPHLWHAAQRVRLALYGLRHRRDGKGGAP